MKFTMRLVCRSLAVLILCGAAVGQQMTATQPAGTQPATPADAQPKPPEAQKTPPPGWSPLDSLNNELPKWLRFSGQARTRMEGFTGGGFNSANEDAYLLTRIWLNMKVQPTGWLKFWLQAEDSHAPWKKTLPAGAPFRDTMDLRMAYVELGDMEKKTFGFRFGRQELDFGEGRLLGLSPWANTPRTFDGFHASYMVNGVRLDAFAARVVRVLQEDFDDSPPGNNLYGVYTSFKTLVPKATFEPYFLWRRQSGARTELAVLGIMNVGTYGLRWVGKLPGGFEYNTDIAGQSGSIGTEDVRAWASHWVFGYTIPKARFTPRFFGEYNYASGDDNPTDNNKGTFDQLYPSGHDKYGLTDQVGWQNIHHLRGGVEFKFTKKWMASGRYNAYWLADAHDALYNASSAVIVRDPTGSSGRFVGNGLDFVTAYTFNPRLALAGGIGHIFPGEFLKNTTPGTGYTYPYAMLTYGF